MPIKVTCPKCQGVLHAPDDAGGKRGKCPTCGTVLAIPAAAHHAEPAPAPFGGFGGGSPTGAGAAPSAHHAEPEPYREAPARMPATPFGGAEPRRPAEPFNKPNRPPAAPVQPGPELEQEIRAWRRTRRGLGWMRCAYFFLMLAVVAPLGLRIAEQYGVTLPEKDPGFLQIQRISADQEIHLGAVAVPVVLSMLFLLLGRLGTSGAPSTSYSKGLLGMATFATLIGVGGFVAFAVPTGGQVAAGVIPEKVADFIVDDLNGYLQHIGFFLVIALLPLAELWFLGGLGRIGAALHHDRLAGRASRFLIYIGLIAFVWFAGSLACTVYGDQVERLWNTNVKPQWDKVGEHQITVIRGAMIFAALVVWLWYVRVVGAGRQAIWSWLERNDPNS